MGCAFTEDLDAVLKRMDAACLVELFGSDGSRRVEQAAIDPVLNLVQVDSDKGLTVDVVEASLGVTTSQRGLTAFESGDGLAVASSRLLTLVTSGTGSTATGRWTSTESLAL